MSDWLGDPDQQPSPWQEHMDVAEDIHNEDRDPRLISVQQFWVYLEQYKREKAEGNLEAPDDMLQETKVYYDTVLAKTPDFPPHLRTRFNNLKRELDELLRQRRQNPHEP